MRTIVAAAAVAAVMAPTAQSFLLPASSSPSRYDVLLLFDIMYVCMYVCALGKGSVASHTSTGEAIGTAGWIDGSMDWSLRTLMISCARARIPHPSQAGSHDAAAAGGEAAIRYDNAHKHKPRLY
jgi:hypothetical protein